MFRTFRKHQSWLMIIIMGITIIAFVIFFSPTARLNGGSSAGNLGSIDGHRIGRDQYLAAQHEAELRYFFTHGSWPKPGQTAGGFDAKRETYQWLFWIQKLKEYDIHVDSATVAREANSILRQMGRGRPVPFNEFVQRILRPEGISAGDFESYLHHDLGIRQLVQLATLSGQLVTPAEARVFYKREHQKIEAQAVFFSASNYLDHVSAPSPAELAQFYTNQMAAYRLPERVQVRYVLFPLTNYLTQAEQSFTNLTAEVETNYARLGTNAIRFGKTPKIAKANIRKELIRQQAVIEARKKADAFANVLFDLPAGQMPALARTNHLTVHVTEPFDQEYGPTQFDGGPNFAKAAFSLTTNDPYGGPLIGPAGVYVIGLDKQIPSEIPPLSQIRSKVASDYKFSHALQLARHAGQAFAETLTNAMAGGQSFTQVCAKAKVQPVTPPPFSLSTTELPQIEDRMNLNQFKQIAFSSLPGEVSGFVPTRRGGLIVNVEKRLPVDQAKMKADLPAYTKRLQQTRQQEALNAWFNREASASLSGIPLGQEESGGGTGSGD